jgi:hypothetical protein
MSAGSRLACDFGAPAVWSGNRGRSIAKSRDAEEMRRTSLQGGDSHQCFPTPSLKLR